VAFSFGGGALKKGAKKGGGFGGGFSMKMGKKKKRPGFG
jgi:hypothetical protein